jgi:hypothetical protein
MSIENGNGNGSALAAVDFDDDIEEQLLAQYTGFNSSNDSDDDSEDNSATSEDGESEFTFDNSTFDDSEEFGFVDETQPSVNNYTDENQSISSEEKTEAETVQDVVTPSSVEIKQEIAQAQTDEFQGQELVEEEEENFVDPRTAKTRVGFTNSPVTKMMFIGGVGLAGFLAVGAFFTFVTGGSGKQAATPVEQKGNPTEVTEADVSSEAPLTEEQKTSVYKTDAAVASQRNFLNQANSKGSATGSTTNTPKADAKAEEKVTEQPAPIPVAAAPMPAPAPLTAPDSMLSTPISAPAPNLNLGQMQEAVEPEDPMVTWQKAATLGSYGSVPSLKPSSPVSVPVARQVAPPVYTPPAYTPTPSNSGGGSLSQIRSNSSVPGLRDTPVASVLVGSSAPGEMATAVIFAADNTTPVGSTDASATKYLVKLSSALKDANGADAIPAGDVLVVTAKMFSSQSGIAEFSVIGVIHNNREYKAPEGAMVVRGKNGAPIALAKRGGKKGNRFINGVISTAVSGLSEVGKAINAPTSSVTTSNGQTTTSTNSGEQSIGAAFLSGAFGTLSQRISQQAQAANQQPGSAVTWELKAGSGVAVFVNNTFEM